MRFRVVETTGFTINPSGLSVAGNAPPLTIPAVLDSAVCYRVCAESPPNQGGWPRLDERRRQAHALAAELEAAYP